MKKFQLSAATLLLFVSASIISCSDDDNTPGLVRKTSLVTAVTGEVSADVNQEIPLNVTYAVENGCATFSRFIETAQGSTKEIAVETTYPNATCVDTTTRSKIQVYKFKSAAAGTYNLKFKKTATEFITHTVVVE